MGLLYLFAVVFDYLLQLLGHGMDSRGIVVWVWQGEEIRVVSEASRRALGPTQLPVQRVPFGILLGEGDHLHVVARFGMSGAHSSNVPQPYTIHGMLLSPSQAVQRGVL